MRISRVAKPYAKALFDLANEKNLLEAVFNDITLIHNTYINNSELKVFLSSPVIKEEKKNQVLRSLFEKSISKLTLDFLTVLFTKSREFIIGDIAVAFIALYNVHKGIVVAQVVSASKLNETQKQEIIKFFMSNNVKINNIQIEEKIDEKLIGGFIATVDNLQIDRSVKSTINTIKKQFELKAFEKQI